MEDEVELIDHPDDPEAAPPPTLPQRDDDPKNDEAPE